MFTHICLICFLSSEVDSQRFLSPPPVQPDFASDQADDAVHLLNAGFCQVGQKTRLGRGPRGLGLNFSTGLVPSLCEETRDLPSTLSKYKVGPSGLR